jgi:hypothetical protein
LDEFQDTSRPQWKILKTFIDEVVMDPEGQRSFFYVGDTKQAIYSWRGGDPDLFFEIFDEFNELEQTIHDAEPLAQSWRSCPAILKFVNQVFGDLAPVKIALEIPDAAAEKWSKAWTLHTASPKTEEVKGYAEWVSVPKNDTDDEEEGSAIDRKALEILKQTSGNAAVQEALEKARNDVQEGISLSKSLLSKQIFPDMALSMLAIGEETGEMDAMLSKAADIFEREVDDAVESLSSLLEPMIMVFLGTIIGGLVVAMYLPIFKLGQVV